MMSDLNCQSVKMPLRKSNFFLKSYNSYNWKTHQSIQWLPKHISCKCNSNDKVLKSHIFYEMIILVIT